LHNDSNELNSREHPITNSLELTTNDPVTHISQNTKMVVEADHLNDTRKSGNNNSLEDTTQVTLNGSLQEATQNELNALVKNEEISTFNDSSKCTPKMDVDQEHEDKSVKEINEESMTKASTKGNESVDVERVDGRKTLAQRNEALTSVSVSQINNQLAKIVDAINSQIKTPCFASSVTLPTTTLNALLSAILSVTTASSSIITPIQNSCTSQLSAFDSTQGSCDQTLSPQSTTCVDSTDGESVTDHSLRNFGLNGTPLHSYNENYYNSEKKQPQNFVHSTSNTGEKNCLNIVQKVCFENNCFLVERSFCLFKEIVKISIIANTYTGISL
jgi:D-lyxose ketol-isomerase